MGRGHKGKSLSKVFAIGAGIHITTENGHIGFLGKAMKNTAKTRTAGTGRYEYFRVQKK
jgi:hypothetical protein